MIKSVLVDAKSPPQLLEEVKQKLASCEVYGLDCETQDEGRHEGLNIYNNKVRHVFDHRRTVMTGFSVYAENDDTAYYFNLAHADEENRLERSLATSVLDAANADAIIVAHNAPFELVMFQQALDYKLNENVVCTLQMAVSHHGPDEYDMGVFGATPLPASFRKFVPDIIRDWADFEPGNRPNNAQQELLSKFIAKESKADHSYNGYVKSIAKGYNLKRLTETTFGYKMTTYQQVLDAHGAKHMGELTGEQVVSYGADDAYWAVKHFRYMLDDMMANNPKALKAFLDTENPMIYLYADSWMEGIRLNQEQVFEQRRVERAEMARVLREYKALLKQALPFPKEPHEKMLKREKYYEKGWKAKRAAIELWANSADSADDFEQCFQVSNPIGNGWAAEMGEAVPKTGKLNLNYYMTMRVIMYDLLGLPVQYSDGSIGSGKEERGKIRLLIKDPLKASIMEAIQTMAEIEQRMKLYLTPYTQLMDPETSRVYPSLSSQLATRRLATSFPNPMQLAKLGESAYIRGFYLGDTDDDVVISADWSAIELVLIGEESGDAGFRQVYGQLPYGDMHSGAAVDGLSVKTIPGLTEDEFKEFKYGRNPNNRVLVDHSGKLLSPSDFHKWARGTAVGKGINFSYWYSGALSTVADNLGWSDKEHWEAVDRYRARFPEAEQWRVGKQQEASEFGFVTLPDGHRRTRFEATAMWAEAMRSKFADITANPSFLNYGNTAIRRIQSRSRNQVVNAEIQGTCATLAKRSLLTLQKLCDAQGLQWKKDWRLMMPIHDELVFSVKRRNVMKFIPILRQAMTTHPEIVSSLPLHCTVAIGRTFRPFNKLDPKMTQIELDEASAIDGVIAKEYEGKALTDPQIETVLDWMFT